MLNVQDVVVVAPLPVTVANVSDSDVKKPEAEPVARPVTCPLESNVIS